MAEEKKAAYHGQYGKRTGQNWSNREKEKSIQWGKRPMNWRMEERKRSHIITLRKKKGKKIGQILSASFAKLQAGGRGRKKRVRTQQKRETGIPKKKKFGKGGGESEKATITCVGNSRRGHPPSRGAYKNQRKQTKQTIEEKMEVKEPGCWEGGR